MWKDFLRCAAAVGRHWLALAGGGLMALLGWLWPDLATRIGHPDWGDAVPPFLIWALVVAAFLSAFFKAWRFERLDGLRRADEQRSRADQLQQTINQNNVEFERLRAVNSQTEEMRLARELQTYNSNPEIKAFQEARTEAIKAGQPIEEMQLALAVIWMWVSSAWGRWQAAIRHTTNEIENREFLAIAASHLLTQLEQGLIAARGQRSGTAGPEFISPDWWRRVYIELVPNEWSIYKASVVSQR